ncbi:hypothetical protein V0U79_08015 [Hyphobacterium sp. HN65]|uniref:Lipoprotein n=1 Tax=Hyphobacterium lacteum TaxID=3116575 RepID=A0ABU7LQX4_9PROT|nr:hypothetical protein [Hyphobacterium sp. HN65]MEE2526309.1 hypothetical protein [Hyphobacterium sp. HN65]
MRFLAVIAIALMAAGCFYSEDDLITRRLAGEPLESGYFLHAPVDPETGEEWGGSTWEGYVRRGRGMRYYSRADNFPHNNARFRSMGGDVWLAQIPARDGPEAYSFGLLWVYEGGVIAYHIPDCVDLEEAVREELGIEPDGEGLCRVDDLGVLESAMSAYLTQFADDIRIDGIYRRVGD